MKQRHGIY